MDNNDVFADIYKINPIDYMKIGIENADFSVRTYGRLKANKVNTIGDLLKRNETDLLSIKGFGRNCYNEVLKYIESLSISSIEDGSDIITPQRQPIWAKDNRDLLYEGKFSDLKPEYLEKDKDYIEKVQEAYAVIDKEIIRDIRENSLLVLEYAHYFMSFHLSMEKVIAQRKEVESWLISLTKKKPNKYVRPYIMAYTDDIAIRNDLLSIWNDGEGKFEELHINQFQNLKIGLVVLKFLQWCHFDVKNEYLGYLDSQRDRQRVGDVLLLRSQHQTLEEVGSIYGITRERVRQIEANAVRKFKLWEKNHKFLAKIAAECDSVSIIQFEQINDLLHAYSDVVIYLLNLADSDYYYVDFDLEVIVYGDLNYSVRVQKYIDLLPDVLNVRELQVWMNDLPEKIPESILNRAIELQYRITGDTYHRSRLSVGEMCKHILRVYYPDGLHIYEKKEIESFRNHIYQDYGDVKVSDTHRALVARISDVGVLCGRGRYKSKQDEYLTPVLCEKIRKYIDNSAESIFLINTLYTIFEDDLRDEGVGNKYYLQGILKEIFGNKYYFRRDYLSKDANLTSIYSAIVSFIKRSFAPVTKAEIFEAFQGLTEIVLNLATSDSEVLNYFGTYIHVDNVKFYDEDYVYVKEVADKLLSKNDVLHSKDLFDYVSADNSEFIERTGAIYPYRLFSLLEYMLADEYQFARPYIAKIDTIIDRPMERFAELLDQQDVTEIDELLNLASDCRFQMIALLDFLNVFSGTHLILDKTHLIKISATGVDEIVFKNVEELILNEIQGTKVISQLRCRELFPQVNVEWSEWFIYSAISKWSNLLEVGLTTRVFKDAVALVAPVGLLNPDEFLDVLATTKYQADNLDNIDDLIADIIEEEIEV